MTVTDVELEFIVYQVLKLKEPMSRTIALMILAGDI